MSKKSLPLKEWDGIMTAMILATIVVVLGGNSAVAADELVYPIDIAVGTEGQLFIADLKLPGLWHIQNDSTSVVLRGEKKYGTPLNAIRCVTVDQTGTVFVGDSATREIYRCDEQWQLAPLTNGTIGIPLDVIAAGEDLFAVDAENQTIWRLFKDGSNPQSIGKIDGIRSLAEGAEGQLICLTTRGKPIRSLSFSGEMKEIDCGIEFEFPIQIVKKQEKYIVLDTYAVKIWELDLNLQNSQAPRELLSGNPLKKPVSLAVSGNDLLVIDAELKSIFRISQSGEIQKITNSF
ncbi:hypothetical protein [Rubinisphaera sp.]|uniref:hypothetical protein n=1 Tax=Rubinisphaera sp. TaxID=2024857 RepID=UPI000C0F0D5F|nr:hypothetical protein [Rubinisphaera sp.]MBV11263.1 hypothetical protein [Rubinisphaera sp.]HCS51179.1 hypothetical protein [Planctomycetaceae bacterium]|tara:strand:- start:294 stop:1166 length:873 start_codon:yes stop_codon:yes gene_type:complete